MTGYCTFVDADTLRVERELPGPIERVWAFLTEPAKRKTWLAAGEVELRAGGSAELVFCNAALTSPPAPGGDEFRFRATILTAEPPQLLAHTWDDGSHVTFELTPIGDRVRLVVTHRQIANQQGLVDYSAGWHAHLNLLADRLTGREPAPFLDAMSVLQAEYAQRIPA